MSKNERIFNIGDGTLLQHAQNVDRTLPDDVGDFTAFDSTISEAYPGLIHEGIDKVLDIKTDAVVIDEMNEKTERLHQVFGECNRTYKTIAYFVRKAFKNNKAKQNQFGLNDIEKARNRKGEMVLFLKSLSDMAAEHRDELIAAGCAPEVIDTLPELLNKLVTTSVDQETFMDERAVITQQRVGFTNDLYKLLLPISQIAHIIYEDDPAMLAKYALPRPNSSTDSRDDLLLSEQEDEEEV